jgi:hypothetical protein
MPEDTSQRPAGIENHWTPVLENALPGLIEAERRKINQQACQIAQLFWWTGWGANWTLYEDVLDFNVWRDLRGIIWSNHIKVSREALAITALPQERFAWQIWKSAEAGFADAVMEELVDAERAD